MFLTHPPAVRRRSNSHSNVLDPPQNDADRSGDPQAASFDIEQGLAGEETTGLVREMEEASLRVDEQRRVYEEDERDGVAQKRVLERRKREREEGGVMHDYGRGGDSEEMREYVRAASCFVISGLALAGLGVLGLFWRATKREEGEEGEAGGGVYVANVH